MTPPSNVEVVQVLGPASGGVAGYYFGDLIVRSSRPHATSEEETLSKVNSAAVSRTLNIRCS